MLKLSDNPPVLAPWVTSLRQLEGRWWVAHAKARNEKAFAWDLHHRGIGYFLPLYEKPIISGGRRRMVLMPVFPSYVFFCGSAADRRAALATNRLCQTIAVDDRQQLVKELSFFEQAIANRVRLDPSANLVEGRACRVTTGPLRGLEGVVVRKGNVSTIFLKISALAGGALLEIESDLLEPID